MGQSPEEKDYTPGNSRSLGSVSNAENFLWGLVGAGMGAVLSWYLFLYLIENYGAIAVAMPGALTGLGRAALMRGKSWLLAGICTFFGFFIPLYIIFTRTAHSIDTLSDWNKLGIFTGGAIAFYLGLGMLRR